MIYDHRSIWRIQRQRAPALEILHYHRGVQPALWSGCPGENGFPPRLYAAIRPKLEDAPVYRGT